jgi:hypothetical protein
MFCPFFACPDAWCDIYSFENETRKRFCKPMNRMRRPMPLINAPRTKKTKYAWVHGINGKLEPPVIGVDSQCSYAAYNRNPSTRKPAPITIMQMPALTSARCTNQE